jgi:hypothetical protein
MKKTLLTGGILLVLGVLAVISYSQQVNPQPYVVPWSNRSFRANKADSVKDGTGNYKPVSEIVAGDTAKNAWRADSVKWGGVYKLLSAFLPDSFGLFLRLHAKADTAADAINARNADSLNHKFPDFDVDLLAESLAVKAPTVGLATLDSLSTPKAKVDTLRVNEGLKILAGKAIVLYGGDGIVMGSIYGNSGLGGVYSDGMIFGYVNGYGTDNRSRFARQSLQAYAKGERPAAPLLGDIIMIDGDGNTDSLLVYMGGAWKLLLE